MIMLGLPDPPWLLAWVVGVGFPSPGSSWRFGRTETSVVYSAIESTPPSMHFSLGHQWRIGRVWLTDPDWETPGGLGVEPGEDRGCLFLF